MHVSNLVKAVIFMVLEGVTLKVVPIGVKLLERQASSSTLLPSIYNNY